MKSFGTIFIDATTEQLERALPFTKGKWKPYSSPLIDMKDFVPGKKIDASTHKFEFAQPRNYLKMKTLKVLSQFEIKNRGICFAIDVEDNGLPSVVSDFKKELPLGSEVIINEKAYTLIGTETGHLRDDYNLDKVGILVKEIVG